MGRDRPIAGVGQEEVRAVTATAAVAAGAEGPAGAAIAPVAGAVGEIDARGLVAVGRDAARPRYRGGGTAAAFAAGAAVAAVAAAAAPGVAAERLRLNSVRTGPVRGDRPVCRHAEAAEFAPEAARAAGVECAAGTAAAAVMALAAGEDAVRRVAGGADREAAARELHIDLADPGPGLSEVIDPGRATRRADVGVQVLQLNGGGVRREVGPVLHSGRLIALAGRRAAAHRALVGPGACLAGSQGPSHGRNAKPYGRSHHPTPPSRPPRG